MSNLRDYLNTITGFNKVVIIKQKSNLGLAKSITTGVTSVCEKYGKVIVLEDDLIASPTFLQFMNDALVFFEKQKK
ncbi:hypothetical protein [Providencia rettgeri]|uniref:hypothetical protein n=1 Tax=Providencia rettgeri TaxID=587 RepID=UPI00031BDF70|nr:hypothetical protein [Providencia rettgeri]